MTYKEVIEELIIEKEEIEGSGYGNCSIEALEIAIEAVRKRIPEDVIPQYYDGIPIVSFCPDCKLRMASKMMNDLVFCPKCGKALEWKNVKKMLIDSDYYF